MTSLAGLRIDMTKRCSELALKGVEDTLGLRLSILSLHIHHDFLDCLYIYLLRWANCIMVGKVGSSWLVCCIARAEGRGISSASMACIILWSVG